MSDTDKAEMSILSTLRDTSKPARSQPVLECSHHTLLFQTACSRGADQQPCLGADLRQALDALFLAGIGRDRQQAWQRVEFPGSFARAGIRGIDVRQRCACHLPLIPFHPKAQTPEVGSVSRVASGCRWGRMPERASTSASAHASSMSDDPGRRQPCHLQNPGAGLG